MSSEETTPAREPRSFKVNLSQSDLTALALSEAVRGIAKTWPEIAHDEPTGKLTFFIDHKTPEEPVISAVVELTYTPAKKEPTFLEVAEPTNSSEELSS